MEVVIKWRNSITVGTGWPSISENASRTLNKFLYPPLTTAATNLNLCLHKSCISAATQSFWSLDVLIILCSITTSSSRRRKSAARSMSTSSAGIEKLISLVFLNRHLHFSYSSKESNRSKRGGDYVGLSLHHLVSLVPCYTLPPPSPIPSLIPILSLPTFLNEKFSLSF